MLARQSRSPPSRTASAPAGDCSASFDWIVGDSAVGLIHLGASAQSVRELCPGTRDTFSIDPEYEADTASIIIVPVTTADTIEVALRRDRPTVAVIDVLSPRFHTSDSLRVGDSITKWRHLPGITVDFGTESSPGYLTIPGHCGIDFHVVGAGDISETYDAKALQSLPDSVHIVRMRVKGCDWQVLRHFTGLLIARPPWLLRDQWLARHGCGKSSDQMRFFVDALHSPTGSAHHRAGGRAVECTGLESGCSSGAHQTA
jgi:hypothetical protein